MTTKFQSFDESRLRGFVESPLGAFNNPVAGGPGRLLVAGGIGTEAGVPTWYTTAHLFNRSNRSWFSTTDMPAPGRASMAAATAATGCAHVAGGVRDFEPGPPASPYVIDTHHRYTPGSHSWQSERSLSHRRDAAVMSSIGTSLYLAGGFDCARDPPTDPPAHYLSHHAFSGSSWTRLTNMIGASREFPVGFALRNHEYLAGGQPSGGSPIASAVRYDPVGEDWSFRASMLNHARAMAAGFTIDERYYMCQGWRYVWPSGETLDETQAYDPVEDSWSMRTPVTGPVAEQRAGARIGNRGLLAGGVFPPTGQGPFVRSYAPAADAWRSEAVLPGPYRAAPAGVSLA